MNCFILPLHLTGQRSACFTSHQNWTSSHLRITFFSAALRERSVLSRLSFSFLELFGPLLYDSIYLDDASTAKAFILPRVSLQAAELEVKREGSSPRFFSLPTAISSFALSDASSHPRTKEISSPSTRSIQTSTTTRSGSISSQARQRMQRVRSAQNEERRWEAGR